MIGHTEMANPIFSTISVEYSWGRWQPEMKKNSKLGHERGSKKGVENTTRNCGKRDQLRVVCHHLFSVTFRFPSKWKWKLYTSIKISKKKSSLNFCAKFMNSILDFWRELNFTSLLLLDVVYNLLLICLDYLFTAKR